MNIQSTTNVIRTPLLCGMCLLSLLFAPVANAALVVQDRLDGAGYIAATQLDSASQNPGGIGWDTNDWTKTGSAAGTYQSTNFFTGSNAPAGGAPPLAGGSINKAGVFNGGSSRLTTDLSTSFAAGDTVWFSYLVAVRGRFAGQFNMGFANSASTDSGIGISISGQQMYARINDELSTGSISAPLSDGGWSDNGTNVSYYVVGQFNKGVGTGNDSLNIWVNQGTTLDPNAPTLSMSDKALAGTPDRFSFNSLTSTDFPNIAIWIDEINLASDSDSLGLTVIPEPGTLGLLAAGCLLIAGRGRRHGGVA